MGKSHTSASSIGQDGKFEEKKSVGFPEIIPPLVPTLFSNREN